VHNNATNLRLRVIIVEDEAPARAKLTSQLAKLHEVQVIAECSTATYAIEQINALKPDVVLLDIELGELSGFDVLAAIEQPCHVIFTTAYNQYAVKAFEKQALDYLLKPFDLNRLRQALDRAVINNTAISAEPSKPLMAKVGDKVHVLQTSAIHFISTQQGMVMARCADRSYHLNASLESIVSDLPRSFLRVHRNCIVNTDHVSQLEKWQSGAMLLRFDDIPDSVTTSRRGALALKNYLNL
jgi:two-component system LytT family response regulator/two-component system response regulator LytT|tara:strand:- start:18256 stop:18978 length:723 start_codon:yes stop_codon:yes gene_type:complete